MKPLFLLSRRTRHLAGYIVALFFVLPLLCACGKKEPPPSAPGYYSGPMRPKGTAGGGSTESAPAPPSRR